MTNDDRSREEALAYQVMRDMGIDRATLMRFRDWIRSSEPPDDIDEFLDLTQRVGMIIGWRKEAGVFNDALILTMIDGMIDTFPDPRSAHAFIRGWTRGAHLMART